MPSRSVISMTSSSSVRARRGRPARRAREAHERASNRSGRRAAGSRPNARSLPPRYRPSQPRRADRGSRAGARCCGRSRPRSTDRPDDQDLARPRLHVRKQRCGRSRSPSWRQASGKWRIASACRGSLRYQDVRSMSRRSSVSASAWSPASASAPASIARHARSGISRAPSCRSAAITSSSRPCSIRDARICAV